MALVTPASSTTPFLLLSANNALLDGSLGVLPLEERKVRAQQD